MKKESKPVKEKEPITMASLTRRNPVPFGDVRKYYNGAKIGTVVLLALCFHVSVVAIALRTDSCVQIPNGIIAVLLICSVLNIAGHYSRTVAGYALSAVCCLVIVLVSRLSGGGISLANDLPEYGEVFRDGAKSTEFWILLVKVLAVVHMMLSIVFIKSALTVKEEPPLKGMNIKIKAFTDWLDKNNNSLTPGRRASDYWFVTAELFCVMIFWAADPNMTKYDICSLIILAAGAFLVLAKQTLSGTFLIAVSAVIRCTLYQYRLGLLTPVVAAYIGLWIAVLYFALESGREAKKTLQEERPLWLRIIGQCFLWASVLLCVAVIPVHEVLAVFSGDLMLYQKDNLPLLFFLPVLGLLAVRSGRWYAYGLAAACYTWLWWTLRNDKEDLFYFASMEQHGSVGRYTTGRMMTLVDALKVVSVIAAVLAICVGAIILIVRRSGHEEE